MRVTRPSLQRPPHFKALNEYLDHSVRRLIREARSNNATNYHELVEDVQNERHAIFWRFKLDTQRR